MRNMCCARGSIIVDILVMAFVGYLEVGERRKRFLDAALSFLAAATGGNVMSGETILMKDDGTLRSLLPMRSALTRRSLL